jgi:SHS2 domain-containing protein
VEPGFEIVEHTADIAIRGRGRTLDELFGHMAVGLFSIIIESAVVEPRVTRSIQLVAAGSATSSEAALLHDWLEELNGLHQVHGEVYARFDVRVDRQRGRLRGAVGGERLDPRRHRAHLEVKAVTWHDLSVREVPGGFEAYALLDI